MRWPCFFMVASGVLLSTLDSSMMNVALPAIMRDFQLDLITVERVILLYFFIITASLVFWGRLADRYGRGRVFITGMTVFIFGAAACGLATSFPVLLLARCVQSFGAAMMMASGPAIIKLTSPPSYLGSSLGLIGLATASGLLCGPALSGVLVSYFSWRAVFLITLPIGLCTIFWGLIYVLPTITSLEVRRKVSFDWAGGMLWVMLVSLYVLFLHLDYNSWYLPLISALLLLTLTSVFIIVEKRAEAPILPVSLVKQRYYWVATTTASFSFAALFVILIILPFYLDYIVSYSPVKIGLVMMAVPITLVFLSPLGGWLHDQIDSARVISSAGLALSTVAVLLLMQLEKDSGVIFIFSSLALLGAGQSVFLAPNSASVLKKVADEYAGITAGILATARNFGMLTGAVIAGNSFSHRFAGKTGGQTIALFVPELATPFLEAMQETLLIALLLVSFSCILSLFR